MSPKTTQAQAEHLVDAAFAEKGTDVEPAKENLPAPLIDHDDDWADVDDGDLTGDVAAGRIPLLPLNRKVDGGFADPETGEVGIRELPVVLLARIRTRAWWPEAFGKGDAAPACRSFDGIAPDPRSPDRQNEVCGSCPHTKWNGDDAPACHEAFEFMVFLPAEGSFGRLARIRFSGLAVSPARAYWESFNARMPKRPPIAYLTAVKLVEKATDNGTFLVPSFERVREFSRAEVQPIIVERDRRIEEWKAAVAEDVESGAGAREPEPFDDGQPGVVVGDEEPF